MGEAVGVPPPPMEPYLLGVLAAYRKLGRDANGGALLSERAVYLDRELDEPGERDAFEQWFDALAVESAAIQQEELDRIREDQE